MAKKKKQQTWGEYVKSGKAKVRTWGDYKREQEQADQIYNFHRQHVQEQQQKQEEQRQYQLERQRAKRNEDELQANVQNYRNQLNTLNNANAGRDININAGRGGIEYEVNARKPSGELRGLLNQRQSLREQESDARQAMDAMQKGPSRQKTAVQQTLKGVNAKQEENERQLQEYMNMIKADREVKEAQRRKDEAALRAARREAIRTGNTHMPAETTGTPSYVNPALGRMDFRTASMAANMADPDSALNRYIRKINERSAIDQYNAMTPEERQKDGSVAHLLEYENARRYANDHPNTWSDLDARNRQWTAERDAAQGIIDEADTAAKDSWNLWTSPTIRNNLMKAIPKITERPEDYNEHADEYDRILYDQYHGQGEHDRIMRFGTREAKEALMQDLREMWRDIDNGTAAQIAGINRGLYNRDAEIAEAQSRLGYANDQLQGINAEINARGRYSDLIGKYRTDDKTYQGYIPANDRGREAYGSMAEMDRGAQTNDVHRIYSFINGGKEFESWANTFRNAGTAPQITSEYSNAAMMTEEEQGYFNNLYNQGKYSEAAAFLSGLQTYLNERYSQYEQIRTKEAARKMPVLASAASLAAGTANTFIAPVRTVAGWLGDESVRDPNSNWYAGSRANDTIQGTIANDLGGTLGKTYRVVMNSAQNVINGLMTAGLGLAGSAQKAASLTGFFGQVYQDSTYKYLKETGDYDQASALGFLDGMMETLEEMLPYEAMLGESTKPIRYFFNNMLSEAGEELTGSTVGERIKGLITGRDSTEKRADEIYHDGGYFGADGQWVALDKRDKQRALYEADMQALREFRQEAVDSAIAGAAGGGTGAMYGGINTLLNRYGTGRTISAENNRNQGKSGAEQLIAAAAGMKGTKSQRMAQELQQAQEQGKKPTNYQIGKLAQNMVEETAEAQGQIVTNTIQREIKGQLKARGVDDTRAEEYADIISRQLAEGGRLSQKDQYVLQQDERAIDVWRTYNSISEERVGLEKSIREETQGQRSVMDTIGDLTGKNAKATSAAAAEVARSVRETSNAKDAIKNFQERRSDLMTEEYAQKAQEILDTNESAKNSKSYLDDVMKIQLAAKSEGAMPRTRLDSEAAQALYDAAKAEFEAADEKRVVRQERTKPGEGVATFNGAEYGTKEWTEQTRSLSKTARNQMGALGEVAARAGMKINFINDEKNRAIYGWENAKTGEITINIAGRDRSGLSHHMLTTVSHEMTHWLEQNSREGYNALRSFILNGLRANGQNVEQMLVRTIDNQNAVLGAKSGESLDINGAMAEIVAKSCENLLSSRTMMEQLAKTEPSVYQKVKSFVRDFTARIREAMAGMNLSASAEARAMYRETEQIAKLWLGGWQEAQSGTTEGVEATDEGNRYSVAQEEVTQQDREDAQRQGFEAPEMLRYSMVGAKARGDYGERIRQAQEMAGNGISDREIYQETGARRGFRGNWWIPIDNGNIHVRGNFSQLNFNRNSYSLNDVIDAPELFRAYPALEGIRVQAEDMPDAYGMYEAKDGKILLDSGSIRDTAKMNVTLRHEIQHAIQQIEGTNQGASMKAWKEIIDRLGIQNRSAGELYARTVGEIEAREASRENSRRGMPTRMQYRGAVAIEDYQDENGNIRKPARGKQRKIEEALQADMEETKGPETAYGDHRMFSVRVEDPAELDFLNNQETITTYKSMQLIDGKLYPPMAAVVAGNMEDYSVLGEWEKATEHPELIKNGNKFTLNKGKGKGSLDAAYNPYMHSSNLMINDQFSGAYNRPELVTVECEVPVSEKDSGYHAEFAKDSVGWHSWHTGTVAGQLRNKKGIERQVFLSRWIKPVRIVSNQEVAQHYAELMDGTDIAVPDNVVTPALRKELEKVGVPIKKSGRVQYSIADVDSDGNKLTEANDIRYSTEQREIVNEDGNVMAEELPGGSYTMYSLAATWNDTDLEELTRDLMATKEFRKKDIQKWIEDVNGIAAMIAADRDRLDYNAMPNSRMLKNNQEYIKTLDASTLCAKRTLYQGIYNEIQHMMPNTPLMPEDLINLINMMKRGGLVTPCGICYVESRRRMLGKYASKWLKEYKGEYIPQLAEVTTTDGLASLRAQPEGSPKRMAYESFVDAMNAKGSANPKVVQLRTDYKPREIRDMTDNQIQKVKDIGGLRVQSFSDFEVPHLIDMMQAVLDMAAKKLTSQAYTKVPEFAWVFGGTGMKINMSLIGKGTGVDANGKLVFDDQEGMKYADAIALRTAYSDNVGTILVGMNDEHIIAAMGDDNIDFIIPFHKSGWGKREMAQVIGMASYKDYTRWQNEKLIEGKLPGRKGYKTIPNKKSKISNLTPVGDKGYWNFKKDGTWNAEHYLQMCAEQKRMPKFANFLIDNGDGSFRMPTEQEALNDPRMAKIRKGYWKLLIDFKMYNNEGRGVEQQTVRPEFNMAKAREILDKYEGGADTLPTNHGIARQFVDEYKKAHPRTVIEEQPPENVRFSVEQPDMDVNNFMLGLNEADLETVQERTMLRQYKDLRTSLDLNRHAYNEMKKRLEAIENKKTLTAWDKSEMVKILNRMNDYEKRMDKAERDIAKVTSSEGYAGLMYRQNGIMRDLVEGKTAEEIRDTSDAIRRRIDTIGREMAEREARIRELANSTAVKEIQTQLNGSRLDQMASYLRKQYDSKMNKQDLMNEMAAIRLKMEDGQDVTGDIENLAYRLIEDTRGTGSAYIDLMRGMTISLSKGQMAELKAQNSSLKELRNRIAGTGIKIGQAKDGPGLDSNWDELCDMIPALGRDTGEKDQVEELISFIESQKQALSGRDMYRDQMDDIMLEIRAVTSAVELNKVTDPEAVAVLKRMNTLIDEMAKGITKGADELKKVQEQLAELSEKSRNATHLSEQMRRNVRTGIQYFNDLSEQSEAAIWRREKAKLIEQLKSDNTKKLIAEQQKWKERIARDKEAREKMAGNQVLRKRVHTNISRMQKLLLSPTDQKNIPEHMQSLAREMIGIVVRNDLFGRKITGYDAKALLDIDRKLTTIKQLDGEFTINDLMAIDDEQARELISDALADLEEGIRDYNAGPRGSLIANLDGFHAALEKISESVATITTVINMQRSINYLDRTVPVEDAAMAVYGDIQNSKYKGEVHGFGSKGYNAVRDSVYYGNMTPEYFIKNLKNRGIMTQWREFQRAENRNGLLMQKSQEYVHALAERTHYRDWADQKIKISMGSYGPVEMTVENAMEICAIWQREHTLNPEMSQHLAKGGIYIENDENTKGRLRREKEQQRAIRIHDEQVAQIRAMLTDEQREYMNGIVRYLSNDMSELGNEASMRMYGVKKFKESYYFPMKVWSGVLSARSDTGISGSTENRLAHYGWSKRRRDAAKNPLLIGNFTQDAMKHIVEQINYNTMAPEIENLNKILNHQTTEYDGEGEETQRNIRVAFQEAYGRGALKYLETFMKDLNGGTVQDQRTTLRDRAISMFKKNAVAGSASVALQQPLSYIRAAMMISPRYLAQAISPTYWKGSYAEMMKHSGVAVIKNMGRFDMNFGQSARDFIQPETKSNVYETVSDLLTAAPEMMDRMTWTRMWSAAKIEQHHLHPEMDMKSDEFLDMVGERFNDVMRRTQVYDSVMVKSSNMRSQKWHLKMLTSFMAEPTLSLNVLTDAVRNVKEKGGKGALVMAGANFVLSAVLQAAVKGVMGSGRSPDDKKTWLENFLYRWQYNFQSEANPFSLIPGYSDVIEVLKNGELKDDAMSTLGKLKSIWDTANKALNGQGKGAWQDLEDTVGQFVQLFTNIPAKNLSRDVRAMRNWIMGDKYAKRADSAAVKKYQAEATFWNADNLLGTLNAWLGEAGFRTTNKAYYGRIFDAMKQGEEQTAADLREYLTLGKGVKDTTIESGIKSAAKESLEAAEASRFMIDNGMMDSTSTLTGQYKDGEITEDEYREMYKEVKPDATEDEVWWKIDQIKYQNETGSEDTPSGYYYRIRDAVDGNKAADIQKTVKDAMAHGRTQKNILDLASEWKAEYLAADSAGKIRIRDAIHKLYKAAGSTAEAADKKINKWK